MARIRGMYSGHAPLWRCALFGPERALSRPNPGATAGAFIRCEGAIRVAGPGRGQRHARCRVDGMAGGKLFSRMIAMAFIGLAFAGCAFVLSSGERSLFHDVGGYEITR